MITRPRHQAQKMADLVTDLGGEPWTFPTIEIAPPTQEGIGTETPPMDLAISNIEDYSWLAFTSINGVSAFFDRMQHLRKDIRSLKDIKICAIGSKTRAELEKRGLLVDYVPKSYTSQNLAEGLRDILAEGDKVLIPRAEIAPDAFGPLKDEGFDINEVPAYRTVQAGGNTQIIRNLFQERKIHILTFTSASTVTNFVEMMSADNIQELLQDVIVACIGPVTARTADDLGITVQVMAKEYTVEGMIDSILEYISESQQDE
jgi:uroporphyrinogen III methyltransferase/synthase